MAKIQQVGAALVLASLAWPARAAELSASGPPECADASELSFRVERRMGLPLAQAAPLAFEVVMEQTAAGYVARIGVTDGAPAGTRLTRELHAADCGKLVDAVSVAVALALALGTGDSKPDADVVSSTAGGEAARTTSAPPPAAAPPPADAGDDESSDETRPALLPSISLWLLGDAGSLPSPSLGAAIGVELGWSQLELRALGTLLFEQEAQLDSPSTPAPGAKLQLVTGGLLACAAPFGSLRAPLSSFACLGAELGQMSGVGTGVASPRRRSAFWAAPLVEVGAAWTVPDTALRLVLAVIGAAPLTRDEFALRDVGTVHQPPSAIGRLSLGASVGFD